jgi:hypothetical protein
MRVEYPALAPCEPLLLYRCAAQGLVEVADRVLVDITQTLFEQTEHLAILNWNRIAVTKLLKVLQYKINFVQQPIIYLFQLLLWDFPQYLSQFIPIRVFPLQLPNNLLKQFQLVAHLINTIHLSSIALNNKIEFRIQNLLSLSQLLKYLRVIDQSVVLESLVQVAKIKQLQYLAYNLDCNEHTCRNVKIVSKRKCKQCEHEPLESEYGASAEMCCCLCEWISGVVLRRVHIHEVVLVNEVFDWKVEKADCGDYWGDSTEEYAYGPNNSYECKLVPLVEVACVLVLLRRELHVEWQSVEHELLDLLDNEMGTVQCVHCVAEQTQSSQKSSKKVGGLECLHFDGSSLGRGEVADQRFNWRKTEQWYQQCICD